MLDPADLDRLSRMTVAVRHMSTSDALSMVLLGCRARAEITAGSRFEHGGVLVFPETLGEVTDFLADAGFEVSAIVPSAVVEQRVRRRSSPHPDARVWVVVADEPVSGRKIEVLALLCPPGSAVPADLAARERAEETETHFAFRTRQLERMRRVLLDHGALSADGGGHNPHYDRESGGTSVLYFRSPEFSARTYRMELISAGHQPEVIDAHLESELALACPV